MLCKSSLRHSTACVIHQAIFILISVSLFAGAPHTNGQGASGPGATPESPANPAHFSFPEGLLKPVDGIKLEVAYSGEVLSNVSGGFRRGTIYEGLLKTGLRIDLDKLGIWSDANIYAAALNPHGPSLTDHYVHDLNILSSIDAYDTIRLQEIWLEKKIFNKQLSIRVGELVADTEFMVSDSSQLFANSCFGAMPLATINLNGPVYPLASPGIRLEWNQSDAWTARLAIFSGDVGQENINNKHGTRFAFSHEGGTLIIAEAANKYTLNGKSDGLPGTLKFGGFYHTGLFEDVNGSGAAGHGSGAVYGIIDQAVYRPSAGKERRDSGKDSVSKDSKDPKDEASDVGLNFFVRGGVAYPLGRTFVSSYLDGGLTYKGAIPRRPKDIFGIACSYTHLSPDITGDDPFAIPSHHETVVEVSYQAVINDWLSVQPDFQYIFNPGGADHLPDAVVLGVRVNLTF